MGIEEGDTDVKAFMRMMDVASLLRRQRENAEQQLDIGQTKAEIRKKLVATAEITGEKLTEAEIETAINSYFSGLYAFREPKKNVVYRMAQLYVDRARIALVYGGGTALLTALGFAGWGTVKLAGAAYRHSVERSVEKSVEASYNKKQKIQSIIETIILLSKTLPEAVEIKSIAQSAETRLNSTDDFFNTFCTEGTADDDVTWENHEEADTKLKPVDEILAEAGQNVETCKGIINLREGLDSTQRSLDSLIQEIRNDSPPQQLLTRAESSYQSGIAVLANKQLDAGTNYVTELINIKTDVKMFAILPSQLEKIFASIKTTAIEQDVRKDAEATYAQGKTYVASVDMPNLRQTVTKLEDLDAILKQSFTVTIVTRQGVKSGIDRYYKDERGKRIAGYYLILEARDGNGAVIPQKIKNEETGNVETVSMWGERVPEEVYERIKKDKQDNGIIEGNLFANKVWGQTRWLMLMSGASERKGQITRW